MWLCDLFYFTDNSAGKFVKAAIKHFPADTDKNIYAATQYITPNRLTAEFSEVIGKPTKFSQVTVDQYKSMVAGPAAEELTETMLLLQDPGYYNGADLSESLALLDEKPTSLKAFIEANKAKWL